MQSHSKIWNSWLRKPWFPDSLIWHIIGKCLSWIPQKCNYYVMGFYHSDAVSISLFEPTAWDFESRQSMKAKQQLTMPFAVSDILVSHMLVRLYHLPWSSILSWTKMHFQTDLPLIQCQCWEFMGLPNNKFLSLPYRYIGNVNEYAA